MGATTHGRALDGGCVRVAGVNFHNPAKTIGLVGVFRGIETGVVLMPVVACTTLS